MTVTLSDLIERVQDELDLQDEDFIDQDEIINYIRNGVNQAKNIINTLYEDYFLARPHEITLVSGTDEYALPSDIYAQKIRKVLFDDGSEKKVIRRIRSLEETMLLEDTDNYAYLITNDATDGLNITFYPSVTTNGNYVKVWYLRSAKTLSALTDVLDVPEAEDYIVQFAKDKCKNKEMMTPDAPKSAALMEEEKLLIEGLSTRQPDDDNEIEPNTQYQWEHN
jgi:hypothetical protein